MGELGRHDTECYLHSAGVHDGDLRLGRSGKEAWPRRHSLLSISKAARHLLGA
jgi:hypothetical protein